MANGNFLVPSLSAIRMTPGTWCCGTLMLFVMSVAVLSKSLKPLGTLSPPCCKTGLSLVVLKLALQASSESCSKTGGASRYLSCSLDLHCFWNLKRKENVSYFSSGEFMAADCSGVIGND